MLRSPPKVSAATVATAAACARARATRTMQLLAPEGPFSDLKLVIMIILIINLFGRDYSTVVIMRTIIGVIMTIIKSKLWWTQRVKRLVALFGPSTPEFQAAGHAGTPCASCTSGQTLRVAGRRGQELLVGKVTDERGRQRGRRVAVWVRVNTFGSLQNSRSL